MRGRLSRGEHGASAVEFAIIAPLFFMITFGAITGSLAYQQRSEITAAAREGARYGATLDPDQVITGCAGSTGACWALHIRQVTITRAFGNLDDGISGRAICVALVEGNPPTLVSDFISDLEGVRPGGQDECYNDTVGITGGADPGRRVQVVARRNGNLNAVLFQMTLSLESATSAQHEAVGDSV